MITLDDEKWSNADPAFKDSKNATDAHCSFKLRPDITP